MSAQGNSDSDDLAAELRLAITSSKVFRPPDSQITVPAEALRSALTSQQPSDNSSRLWIREATVVGELVLDSVRISSQILFEDCIFTDTVDLTRAEVPNLELNRCNLKAGFRASQIEVRWNLSFDASAVVGEIDLMDAKVGGMLSLVGATVEGGERDGDTIALGIDRIQATSIVADKIETTGMLSLIGAKISGQLSFDNAVLRGVASSQGKTWAIHGDGAEIPGGVFGENARVTGTIKLISAEIGPLTLTGARLGGSDDSGGMVAALSAEGTRISGGMWCDEVDVNGEIRLISAKIEGQLSLNRAKIGISGSGFGIRALGAADVEVTAGAFCDGLRVKGEVALPDARIGSRLVLARVTLAAGEGDRALNLTGATIDELILVFDSVDGLVDLQQTKVRSLWDAHEGQYLGKVPAATRLDGFSYQTLREPLDAKLRLEWLESSQRSRYYPSVYAELATAFRRIGRSTDARRVAIAGEGRAREELPQWSPRRGWSWLLYWTVGYGYRNWLAAVWLGVALLVGWLTFLIGKDSFEPAQAGAPDFNPALYAIDVTIPVLDAGQQSAWTPTGRLVWASMALTVIGYALATAVIAAAAGLLNRDQR